jgi:hypothetical protein
VIEEYKYANVVIFGTVIKKEFVTLKETMDAVRLNDIRDSLPSDRINILDGPIVTKVIILIDKKYKCKFQSDSVVIYTARMGAACGYLDFEIGKQFIIYAFNSSNLYRFLSNNDNLIDGLEIKNSFWTNQCTRTTGYYSEDKKELDKIVDKK